jgi:hypothetical protein
MKKVTLISVFCLILTASNLIAQIKVASNGNVGIANTSPAYKLDVNGNFRAANIIFDGIIPSGGTNLGSYTYMWGTLYSYTAYFMQSPTIISDKDVKINITNLTGTKDKLKLLRPVSYNFKTDLETGTPDKTKTNLQYGFIAQELQDVYPDIVTKREDGILGVRYTELIPVLVQAIKEQQEEIDALNKRITELEKNNK